MIYSHLKKNTLNLLVLCTLFSCGGKHQTNKAKDEFSKMAFTDSLDIKLENLLSEGNLPGFALSIFTKDRVFYQKGFGYANVERQIPFNSNTVQGIASISKTLIAVSVMKLVEEGKLSLDDKINDILPFEVTNPNFSEVPITIRHLATHTSSINDAPNYDRVYIFKEKLDKNKFQEGWHKHLEIYNQNKEMTMPEFLGSVFARDGNWRTDENFLNEKPGTYYEYSNMGTALLAYIVEIKTGEEYKDYTKRLILDPIGMNRSGWSLNEVDTINHIVYYNEDYNPVPSYHVITYPDGGLNSTVSDLTKYLQEMMKGYYGESKLLSEASFREMMKNQTKDLDIASGIIWDLSNDCCIGHGGNDFGVTTMMFFDPQKGIGKILFSNISIEYEKQSKEFYQIFNTMFQYDSEILKMQQVAKDENH
ncbi:serine hydrolase domain-containing protein [Xanthovirga aplysinae]|uniref:serine hydrolase domain-containing protein n=1 Tax=Xanthovirga aplysinae TaxID=2529853 RepID=UPI0016569BD4|nr:serine hydrolase domain-containing protein [Xanthovirga aplysinae]